MEKFRTKLQSLGQNFIIGNKARKFGTYKEHVLVYLRKNGLNKKYLYLSLLRKDTMEPL